MIIVQMGIALSDNSASKGIYGIAHKTNLVVWVKKKNDLVNIRKRPMPW